MKSIILPTATANYICHIFIQDTSSVTGGGLTGLTFDSSGLTGYYMRSGASAAVQLTMVTIGTLGTYAPDTAAKCGFKEVDATNMPGVYEIQLANNCLATGADAVTVMFKGATNMAPVVLEIQMRNVPGDTRAILGTALTESVGGYLAAGFKKLFDVATPVLTADASGMNVIADALLKRDWTSVTGEAARSVLNALRFVRNKWTVTDTTLSVKKEDDSTEAWSATITTDAAANPITSSDPA